MRLACVALFLNVIYVSIRRALAIAADDAAAAECGESEEPNKTTHTSLHAALEQFAYRVKLPDGCYKDVTTQLSRSNFFEQIGRSAENTFWHVGVCGVVA